MVPARQRFAERDVYCEPSGVDVPGLRALPPSFRQIQIAQLLADGYMLAGAAAYLYITRSTAKRHLEKLGERLGKHGQVSIVVEMMRRGLVK